MRWVAIGLVTVLAACTSVTDGQGSAAPQPSRTSSPTPSSSPSIPPSITPSIPPSSSPSVDLPTTAPTGCPAGSIAPTGAPFCYPSPAGFTDYSTRPGYAPGWTYRTLLAIGRHDLIEVLGAVSPTSFDGLSDAQLRAYYDRAGLITVGKLGFVRVSAVTTTRLDGARAFNQQGRYSNGVDAVLVRAFTGRTIVFVSCQSELRAAEVAAACRQVLTSIMIERR